MKTFRRTLLALVFAAIAATGVRLGGKGGVAPQRGGWRPLDIPPDSDSTK